MSLFAWLLEIGIYLFLFAQNAWADNCGSLRDCYDTMQAATGVGVGIAILTAIALLLDRSGFSSEAEAGETKKKPEEPGEKTWDQVTNERIEKLDPSIRQSVIDFINDVEKNLDIKLRVSQSYRTNEEQDEYYNEGRQGIEGESVVTRARGGESYHNYGLAFDVVEIKNGEPNYKINWNEVAKIGKEKYGFEWGGDWNNPDKPHFQKPTKEAQERIKQKIKEKETKNKV